MKQLFIVLLLLLLSMVSYGQVEVSRGIFAIQDSVSAVSSTTFVESDGYGESFYETQKLANNQLKVTYTYRKTAVPNPVYLSYSFPISQLSDTLFSMDMRSVMPPLFIHIDTSAISITYEGEHITVPNYVRQDTVLLPNAIGTFTLKKIKSQDILLTYNIAVENRKIVKNGIISLLGNTYHSYKHTYSFKLYSFLMGNQLLHSYADEVEETYLEGCGLVNQAREGNMIFINEGNKLTQPQKVISKLLKIRVSNGKI